MAPSSTSKPAVDKSVAGGGLRARRRRETEQAIHTAAVRLVERHGLAQVTVDMISEEAGVSPRTFFNYFPTKESALLTFGPPPLSEEERERLGSGSARPQDVLNDLVATLDRRVTSEFVPDREHARAVLRIARTHPELQAALHARFDAFEQQLTAAVARRTGAAAGDPLPSLLTGIALAVLRTALDQWSNSPDDSPESPEPAFERSTELLRTLIPGM